MAEFYIVIVNIVKLGPRSARRRRQGNFHRAPCTNQNYIYQLISADIFLQLTFINKEKKLLSFAVGKLSDEIHI